MISESCLGVSSTHLYSWYLGREKQFKLGALLNSLTIRCRESEFNYLEANEDTDTNYDLTSEECDPQLEVYNYKLIQLQLA